ncbi:unnamed protein product [Sphagnum jensenii]|uniref:Fe2OG dioxygenase domain-containing protein n=1 Tax=Sphagnum jensenii TaxID=128206 RepID=A0ABP1B6S5_9BRYO
MLSGAGISKRKELELFGRERMQDGQEERRRSSSSSWCFVKPSRFAMEEPTAHLYVANCGPAVGIPISVIRDAFSMFGRVTSVLQPAGDSSGSRVYVSYVNVSDAVAARQAWNGRPCDLLQGRVMLIQHAVPQQQQSPVEAQVPVFTLTKDIGIPGLSLYTDFISPEDEQELLTAVDAEQWTTLAKRRVQHYGYEFLYKTRNVDKNQKLGVLPLSVEPVLSKVALLSEMTHAKEPSLPLDQLTVNEYPRGVGLSPHIDTHSAFEGSIISLSLAGPCIMEFRKYKKKTVTPVDEISHVPDLQEMSHQEDGVNDQEVANLRQLNMEMERKALFLPQRSLLIMSEEARYAWYHYIPHHKLDDINGQIVSRGPRRVSFTFRKVRSGPCTCIFPEQCDSQQPHLSTLCPSNDDNNSSESSSKTVPSLVKPFNSVTPEIEKTYVHKVYDAIAPHFSATRFAKWPKVALFLNSLEAGSVIADAGCGNGKYLGLNPKCLFVGCDISPPLVEICTQQGHEALVADALHLPYRTGFCDAAISIAVLHHLSNEGRRVRAIEELLRVVHKKGKVLITVWAVEQEDKKLLSKWTPLTCKYMDEWVDDVGTKFKRNLSTSSLGSIKEGSNEDLKELTLEKDLVEQQEYFVPWHLPYHRAEVGGASAAAVASGLAKKDDTKRAVVYNRYYHCFVQGELERLVSGVPGARIIDQFYDKSNWCVVIERL